jgi:hypothetical protein
MFSGASASPLKLLVLAATGMALLGCASQGTTPSAMTPTTAPEIPPAVKPQEIAGRWGLAAFHKPEDRARTEAAARNGCRQPYVIGLGSAGGVVMHMPDTAQPQELRVKGAPGNKTFIGPEGEPGGMQDREITSFDGRVMTIRFIDPEVASRYGTQVYVRCAPRA